jgi:hypothetical protein
LEDATGDALSYSFRACDVVMLEGSQEERSDKPPSPQHTSPDQDFSSYLFKLKQHVSFIFSAYN